MRIACKWGIVVGVGRNCIVDYLQSSCLIKREIRNKTENRVDFHKKCENDSDVGKSLGSFAQRNCLFISRSRPSLLGWRWGWSSDRPSLEDLYLTSPLGFSFFFFFDSKNQTHERSVLAFGYIGMMLHSPRCCIPLFSKVKLTFWHLDGWNVTFPMDQNLASFLCFRKQIKATDVLFWHWMVGILLPSSWIKKCLFQFHPQVLGFLHHILLVHSLCAKILFSWILCTASPEELTKARFSLVDGGIS